VLVYLIQYCIFITIFRVANFPLTFALISAFGLHGNLRSLVEDKLQRDRSICIADCHDSTYGDSYSFGDETDAMLATCFLLGRGEGTPLVYSTHTQHKSVVAALKFFHHNVGISPFFENELSSDQLLFVRRGSGALMVINKSNEWIDRDKLCINAMQSGSYLELCEGFEVQFEKGGDGQTWVCKWGSNRGGFSIGPRTVLFLIQK
jgi:hypothetical protein